MWPQVFIPDDKNRDKSEPRIAVGQSYISHHPDYWSAVPSTGMVFFYIRKPSEVGERSEDWIQFVMMFVMAAIDSPSLAHLQSHSVTHAGLRQFVLRGLDLI